jgi:glycine cleavage system transcriptional repressor
MNDTPAQTRQLLAVSAIGPDRPGLVHDLTRAINDCGGSIAESRMASLGTEFAMVLLVSGNWHTLARLESELKKVADECGLTLQLRRTEQRGARRDQLPYSIDIVSLDQTGIVAGLSGFCAARSIDIGEVATRCYAAAHTGAPMFAVQMIINVPAKLHVSQLREEFMDYCDNMNLDAILEPVKS